MADEKQPAPDSKPSETDGDTAKDGAPPESPWDGGTSDAAVSGDVTAADAEKKPRRWGGRWSMAALLVLGLLGLGFYLSWPIRQLDPPAVTPQVNAAVKALDDRVARLEAANARRDQAFDAFTKQLDDLSQGLSGGEVLATLRGKLAAMEQAVDQLGQKAGENGVAALAALGAEVNDLKTRLGALASGLARPKSEPESESETGTVGAGAPAAGPSQEEVTALARQTADLARQTRALASDNAALSKDNEELRQALASLQARLEQMQGAVQQSVAAGQKAGAGQGLVLAIGQLRQTVLAGAPYTAALAAATALAGDDVALQRAARALAPTAGTGIVSLRALSDQYAAMARAVLRAGGNEADNFWRRTMHRLTSLVTVRRVGEVDGMEADAILARAERRLAAGDLAAAASLIEGLDGPAAKAAQPWLEGAKARLAAMAALTELQSLAIAQLADG